MGFDRISQPEIAGTGLKPTTSWTSGWTGGGGHPFRK